MTRKPVPETIPGCSPAVWLVASVTFARAILVTCASGGPTRSKAKSAVMVIASVSRADHDRNVLGGDPQERSLRQRQHPHVRLQRGVAPALFHVTRYPPVISATVTRSVPAFESNSASIAASTTDAAAPTAIGALISLGSSTPSLSASIASVKVPLGACTRDVLHLEDSGAPVGLRRDGDPGELEDLVHGDALAGDREGVDLQRQLRGDADGQSAQLRPRPTPRRPCRSA